MNILSRVLKSISFVKASKLVARLMTKSVFKLMLLVFSFSLTILSTQFSYAEDIEIYENIPEQVTSEKLLQPNILFVLDTSGSMTNLTGVSNPKDIFDPDKYSDDGNIYVYDLDFNYSNIYFPKTTNKCDALDNFYADPINQDAPEYRGKGMFWRYTPESSTKSTTCVEAPEAPVNYVQTFTDKQKNVNIFNVNVAGDTKYQLEWTLNAGGLLKKIFLQEKPAGSGWVNIDVDSGDCSSNSNNISPQTRTCEFTTSSNATKIRLITNDQKIPNTPSTVVASLVKFSTVCTPTPGASTIPASSNWFETVPQANLNEIEAFECAADNGLHGVNDASGDVFPQLSSGVDIATTAPQYTSTNTAGSNVVDWDSVTPRVYVTSQYHQYLQNPVTPPAGTPTVTYNPNSLNSANVQASLYCKEGGGTNLSYFYLNSVLYQCQSRVAVMKQAVRNVLKTTNNINVGLMRFNATHGGTLTSAVKDIGEGSNRADLIAEVLNLPAQGATPLQEVLYEAKRYFSGDIISFQTRFPESVGALHLDDDVSTLDVTGTLSNIFDNNVSSYKNITIDFTDPDGYVLDRGLYNYVSPITNQCQDNTVILFSDGEPTRDRSFETKIESFSGLNCEAIDGEVSGKCLDELAYGLANKDVNASKEGINNVYTHVIGFDLQNDILEETAKKGKRPSDVEGSNYHIPEGLDELQNVFKNILFRVQEVKSDTFAAPSVSVNASNRLQNRDELYYALFKPSNTPRWNGNIKKYKITADGVIRDSKNLPAVDQNTGFFKETARSIWSTQDDGDVVTEGGFAGTFDGDPVDADSPKRNIWGVVDATINDTTETEAVNLINGEGATFMEKFIANTSTISDEGFGLVGNTVAEKTENKENVVKWLLGADVDQELVSSSSPTDPNQFVGETLHSTPYVLTYGTNPDPDYQKDIIFSTTNQGLLHAINGQSGEEEWAYIADPSLFKNFGAYYNQKVNAPHAYGLDGEIEFKVERAKNQSVTKAHLFIGQRRGGDKYFGIDVTNALPINVAANPNGPPSPTPGPEKLWTITGEMSDFDRMGQTWAKPVSAKVNYCDDNVASTSKADCPSRDVLFLSGGYDTKYDGIVTIDPVTKVRTLTDADFSLHADSVKGNAIYMVDAADGSLLWMAGKTDQIKDSDRDLALDEMEHSFPTEPTVIDADFDGIADLLFVTDISGQIFRIDFQGHITKDTDGNLIVDDNDIRANPKAGVNEVSGGVIADLSDDSANRKFYNRLDVSLIPATKTTFARYAISIGSGYRAHPLLDEGGNDPDWINKLYVIFDENTQNPQANVDSNGEFANGSDQGVTYDYVDPAAGTAITYDDIKPPEDPIDLVSTNKHGFFIGLSKGSSEKLINPTLTNNGSIIAVSYSPNPVVNNNGAVCEADIGSSTVYQVDLLTGVSASKDLTKPGLSPGAIVLEIPNENPELPLVKILCIGTECAPAGGESTIKDGKIIGPIGLGSVQAGDLNKINWWEKLYK